MAKVKAPPVPVRREQRGHTFWVAVVLPAQGFTDAAAVRRCNGEARAWARELGLSCGGSVSGGATLGPEEIEFRQCYVFR